MARKKLRTIYELVLVLIIMFAVFRIGQTVFAMQKGTARFAKDLAHLSPVEGGIDLDLKAFEEINPDIVGWLRVEGTGVDFPVLMDRAFHDRYAELFSAASGGHADLSEFGNVDRQKLFYKYLYCDYRGEDSVTGSITLDYRNSADLKDPYVMIYGHNAGVNNVMFSDLKRFEDREFFDEHRTALLFTGSGTRPLELVCVAAVSGYSSEVFGLNGLLLGCGFDTSSMLSFLAENAIFSEEGFSSQEGFSYVVLSTCYDDLHPEDPLRLVLLYRGGAL